MRKSKTLTNRTDTAIACKCGYDGNPPVFGEKRDFVEANGKRELGVSPYNCNIDRIEWLFSHARIEQRQYDAANRLYRDFYLSQISSVVANLAPGGGGAHDAFPNDVKVDAMRRHGDARTALGRIWPIVELVVEQNRSVEKAAAILHINHRECTGLLKAALHVLADHYSIA
jgi:hypothetical protein